MIEARVCIGLQLPARDRQVDADRIEPAFLVAPVRCLDHHTARRDPVVKIFEFRDLFPNPGLDGLGRFHASKGDLHWNFHGASILQYRNCVAG